MEQIPDWESLIAERSRPCATMPKDESPTVTRKRNYNKRYKARPEYKSQRKPQDAEYRKNHREQRNEYNREYRKAHRDEMNEYCRQWRLKKKLAHDQTIAP